MEEAKIVKQDSLGCCCGKLNCWYGKVIWCSFQSDTRVKRYHYYSKMYHKARSQILSKIMCIIYYLQKIINNTWSIYMKYFLFSWPKTEKEIQLIKLYTLEKASHIPLFLYLQHNIYFKGISIQLQLCVFFFLS